MNANTLIPDREPDFTYRSCGMTISHTWQIDEDTIVQYWVPSKRVQKLKRGLSNIYSPVD